MGAPADEHEVEVSDQVRRVRERRRALGERVAECSCRSGSEPAAQAEINWREGDCGERGVPGRVFLFWPGWMPTGQPAMKAAEQRGGEGGGLRTWNDRRDAMW